MTRVERSRWIESGSLAVRTALASLLGSALVIAAPAAVSACSVCTAGRDEENQLAFLLSTLFMSALPLVVIGTIVFVFWRRLQKLEAEEAAREALSAAPSPSGSRKRVRATSSTSGFNADSRSTATSAFSRPASSSRKSTCR